MAWLGYRRRVSCSEGADLDEVMGEDAVSAPGSGTVDAGEFGAVPAVASFQVIDPSFGPCPPFDLVAECSPMFEFATGGTGLANPRDPHIPPTELVEVAFNGGIAIAAIGGHRARWCSDAADDPFDRWSQLRCVWRVSGLDSVVEDDAVGVVDDLGFVPELLRLAQPSFTYRAGIGVVQAHHTGGRVGHHPGQSAASLYHHPPSALQHRVEVVDRLGQPTSASPGGRSQRAAGIAQHRRSVTHCL